MLISSVSWREQSKTSLIVSVIQSVILHIGVGGGPCSMMDQVRQEGAPFQTEVSSNKDVPWRTSQEQTDLYAVSTIEIYHFFIAGSFKSQLIDYFRGHIISWEAFGRFMLIRTK